MRINHNIAALNTHRQLGQANDAQQSSMEKLSSGLRINGAKDDAAGLAISEKMRGQIRGLDQATSNAQDANSMIQTAEGALNETHDILQRMRELSVQSSNDTNTETDRGEIQKEVNQLSEELTRISDNTEFNTQNLLDGSFEGKFQIGANADQNVELQINEMSAEALKVSGDGEGVALTEITSTTSTGAVDLSEGEHKLNVADFGDNLSVDGQSVKYGLQNEEGDFVALADSNGEDFSYLSEATSREDLAGASFEDYGTDQLEFDESVRSGEVSVTVNDSNAVTEATANASIDVEGLATGSYTVETGIAADADAWNGTDVDDTADSVYGEINSVLLDDEGNVSAVSADDSDFYAIEDLDLETTIDTDPGTDTFVDDVVQGGADPVMSLGTAATDGDEFTVEANGGIDVSTQEAANGAIETINDAIETVSGERSKLGAMQNRLDHTINNLGTSSENLTAAESRIRDVDMAKEMMNQTKNSILSQASQSMLAQANQQPQGVLQLLQ
ncbi:flagellin [Halobacillus seohaensis]|uniref:Flagellin n=1 Tax=Halobacillus seohaensis TaxID=447421 RepID=A0ABW2EQJ4_9BACI